MFFAIEVLIVVDFWQGIKPDNYHKVENSEVREIIDLCIQLKREDR
jgi:hypothetical protein